MRVNLVTGELHCGQAASKQPAEFFRSLDPHPGRWQIHVLAFTPEPKGKPNGIVESFVAVVHIPGIAVLHLRKIRGETRTQAVRFTRRAAGACHGATGQGNPAIVRASKGAMQHLASKEVQDRTDERLAKDIAGGTGQKKPIKPLTEKQMKDAIAFVRTMAKK